MEYKDAVEAETLKDPDEIIKKHALEILHMLSGLQFWYVRKIVQVVEDSVYERMLGRTFEIQDERMFYGEGTYHGVNDAVRDIRNKKMDKFVN